MRSQSSWNSDWSPAAGPQHGAAEPGPVSSHFLHAGHAYVAQRGQPIVMILGSCVGVCLWDALNGIGGATHYLLPVWDGRGLASPRYGSIAIHALLQKLTEAGALREQLRAKVFGGGCLFASMRAPDPSQVHLGQ